MGQKNSTCTLLDALTHQRYSGTWSHWHPRAPANEEMRYDKASHMWSH